MKTIIKLLMVIPIAAICLLAFIDPNIKDTVIERNVEKKDSIVDPFKQLSYDEVYIYNFNYDTAKKQRLDMEFSAKQFNYHKVKKTSLKKLDTNEVANIIRILSDTATYGGQNSACFMPRMGITFIKNKQQVFNVLICLECNSLESTSEIPAMFHSSYVIYPDDSKPVTLYNFGFSETGKKALLKLCEECKLGFCKKE